MLAIIGCGNPNRTDDGVGPEVIARLRLLSLPDGVALYDAGTDGMSVLYRARGLSQLIIVDAKAPEEAPGAIFEVPGEVLQSPPPNSFNLHDFRWDHALHAGRQIYGDDFPKDVQVFLIEAQSLDLGIGLSAAASKAVDDVVKRIAEMAMNYVGQTGARS
ncbi:MAG: hydrogenase maturation protease [Alphaproteobacteria bacterium]|nr:hydrogenase maturation protease [Alphaproteobacteria bacterium]